ncbi:MAG: hypothetical protein K2M82_04650 [Lachnospiraceae bacterium]|nr:hypothetical protein [Lachnospiraceae bacterium]
MQVSSRITINTIAINQLTDLAKIALEQTAEALHTEVVQAEVMPRDTGALQGEQSHLSAGRSVSIPLVNGGVAVTTITRVQNDKVSIVSSTPYARRLYFHPEYNFHRGEWFDAYGEKHGGNIAAGGKWFEPWISGEYKDFCPKTFKKLYKRLLRGVGR